MARYYLTDAWSTWNIMDPEFPDELPEVGQRVYVAIVDGPLNKDSNKAFSEVYTIEYRGLEWLQLWYESLRKEPTYGKDVTIIWVEIPPAPKLPKQWRVCGPTVCENHKCDDYDNGYCMGRKKCADGKIHREFSRRDY